MASIPPRRLLIHDELCIHDEPLNSCQYRHLLKRGWWQAPMPGLEDELRVAFHSALFSRPSRPFIRSTTLQGQGFKVTLEVSY